MSMNSKCVLGLLGAFGLGALAALAVIELSAPRAPGFADTELTGASPRSDLLDAVAVSSGLLQTRVAAGPPIPEAGQVDVAALLAQAADHRRKRDFARACQAYALLASRGAMDADAWADYADAQAALSGGLSGEPARSIEAALEIDPRHAKALWLKASLAHEEHRYDDALATWKRLLAVVPEGSSDARIVEANIAEATRLARG